MRAFERKFGFLEVIELRRLPGGCAVAFAAIGSAALSVRIVGRVTRHALRRRIFVTVAEVTCEAGYFAVLSL